MDCPRCDGTKIILISCPHCGGSGEYMADCPDCSEQQIKQKEVEEDD